jgi:hypothetical protein
MAAMMPMSSGERLPVFVPVKRFNLACGHAKVRRFEKKEEINEGDGDPSSFSWLLVDVLK